MTRDDIEISCSASVNRSEIRQYSQRPSARDRTSSRRAASMSGIARGRREFHLSRGLRHPDQVFKIFVSLPVFFV